MATYEIFSYAADALVYDESSATFTLDPGFTPVQDLKTIVLSDKDGIFDADLVRDKHDEKKNQSANMFDSDGSEIASGCLNVDRYGYLEGPDGSQITIDRLAIAGEPVSYITGEQLKPGTRYRFFGAQDSSDNLARNDARHPYDCYEDDSLSPGYGPGTMIATNRGEVPVEWLDTSDQVLTRDHGYQKILWVGRTKVTPRFFARHHREALVEIPVGAFGEGRPVHALKVTGDHRVLLRDPIVDLHFFEPEALAPAKAWADAGAATVFFTQKPYTLTHILCESHEVILAQGAWVETLSPSPRALRRLNPDFVVKSQSDLRRDGLCQTNARICLTRGEAEFVLRNMHRETSRAAYKDREASRKTAGIGSI
ncbi:MAG: Hint domain-containing protein [Pseudomonadota bacterium]